MLTALNECLSSIMQLVFAMLIAVIFWWGHRAIAAKKKRDAQKLLPWLGITPPTASMQSRFVLVLGLVGFSLLVTGLERLVGLTPYLDKLLETVPVAKLAQIEPVFAAVIAGLAYAFIKTGAAEELLVRGLLYRRLLGWFGYLPANLIQATLFALLHNGIILLALPDAPILLHIDFFFRIFVASFVLGWYMEKKDGGSIVMPWISHGVTNFFTFLTFLLPLT